MKLALFVGDSLEVIRSFPDGARREVGYQIDRVQRGLDPSDWKPMKTIGAGVREIRVRDLSGAFRVIYIATFAEAVVVLHAFRKKAQATSRRDLELARARLSDLTRRA
jgi:phage-related protein